MNNNQERLARQFAKSLQKWGGWQARIVRDPTHLITDVSAHVARTFGPDEPLLTGRHKTRQEEWQQMVYFSRVFFNGCLVQELGRWTNWSNSTDFLMDSLDSPIEALMLFSLILCAREHSLGVSVVGTHPTMKYSREEHTDFSQGSTRLTVEIRPQSYVGEHRVDFVLSYYGADFVRTTGREAQTANEWQEVRVDKKMIVECDGHDFHEKTKEQARRDKQRDRNLQSLGFAVYRYTGSELYANVFHGAAEIVHVLTRREFPKDDPDDKGAA